MSGINLFQKLTNRQPVVAEAESIVANSVASATEPAWKSEPVSVGQKIAIHKFFLRKNLAAESDPAWLAKLETLCVFAEDTGYWLPPVGFTKGEASELQQRLYDLPWLTKAEREATQPAKPVAAPAKAATVPAKPETAFVSSTVPDGWEIRFGKKGPYLAKAK